MSATDETTIHPAVEGWPEKYSGTIDSNSGMGPRILSTEFQVIDGTDALLNELDVNNWPTWTTSDKEKWAVGNQNKDKIMPYGELSYMLEGRLEIIPADTGVPVIIEPGMFVTFPEGFQSSWKVLEELTWHYYLY